MAAKKDATEWNEPRRYTADSVAALARLHQSDLEHNFSVAATAGNLIAAVAAYIAVLGVLFYGALVLPIEIGAFAALPLVLILTYHMVLVAAVLRRSESARLLEDRLYEAAGLDDRPRASIGTHTSDFVMDIKAIPESGGVFATRAVRLLLAYLPYFGWYIIAIALTLFIVLDSSAIETSSGDGAAWAPGAARFAYASLWLIFAVAAFHYFLAPPKGTLPAWGRRQALLVTGGLLQWKKARSLAKTTRVRAEASGTYCRRFLLPPKGALLAWGRRQALLVTGGRLQWRKARSLAKRAKADAKTVRTYRRSGNRVGDQGSQVAALSQLHWADVQHNVTATSMGITLVGTSVVYVSILATSYHKDADVPVWIYCLLVLPILLMQAYQLLITAAVVRRAKSAEAIEDRLRELSPVGTSVLEHIGTKRSDSVTDPGVILVSKEGYPPSRVARALTATVPYLGWYVLGALLTAMNIKTAFESYVWHPSGGAPESCARLTVILFGVFYAVCWAAFAVGAWYYFYPRKKRR